VTVTERIRYQTCTRCNGQTGQQDLCHVRGGGFNTLDSRLACRYDYPLERNIRDEEIAFRCCADKN
jgi:hypothetical protein